MKPAHRDDLPMEVVAELEKKLAELHPGYKVVFSGDMPGGPPPGHEELGRQLQERGDRSLRDGTCIDCQAVMPNYDPDREGWEAEEGWGYFSNGTGDEEEFMGWQCPDCEAQEDGQPRPFRP